MYGLSCFFKLDTENQLGDEMCTSQCAVLTEQASLPHPCLVSGFDKLLRGVTHRDGSSSVAGAFASSWGGGHKKSKVITVRAAASYAT